MEIITKEITIEEIINAEKLPYVEEKPTAQEDLMEYCQKLNLRPIIRPDKDNADETQTISLGNPVLGYCLKPRIYGGVEKQRNTKGGKIYERRKSVY